MHPYAATPPTSPRLPPPSLPTQLCPLFFFFFFFFSFINGNTLREYFFSQQLSVANSSWLGWDFVSTCPLPAGTWCGFSFHGTCHNCYKFICAASLLCPEDPDSLHPFTTSVSQSLRSLFQWSLRLGRGGRRIEAPLRAEYSVGSYSAPWLSWVSVVIVYCE